MNAKDHMRITEFTLKNFRDYLSPIFTGALETGENEKELVQGTDDEDNHTPERATNWHFYRSENDHEFLQPFDGYFNVTYHPSSRRVLGERTVEFVELMRAHQNQMSVDSEYLFNLLGRLIHHVQDMSTPSHVVPVFHGPELFRDFHWEKDTYEEFSKDNIAGYLKVDGGKLDVPVDSLVPEMVSLGFVGFYDHAARRTLKFLDSDESRFEVTRGAESKAVSCDLFWQGYDRETDPNQGKHNRGFGEYGPKEKYFGEDTALTIDGLEYDLKFSSYEHVFTRFVSNAISDTLMCLIYADKCYNGEHVL